MVAGLDWKAKGVTSCIVTTNNERFGNKAKGEALKWMCLHLTLFKLYSCKVISWGGLWFFKLLCMMLWNVLCCSYQSCVTPREKCVCGEFWSSVSNIHAYIYVCMYMHMYMYRHMYMSIHTYTHRWTKAKTFSTDMNSTSGLVLVGIYTEHACRVEDPTRKGDRNIT